MLKGIDISNWQEGLKPSKLDVDFCICKTTEGTFFIDPCCDGFIQDCLKSKKLFGYYHFAGNGNARQEAKFFWNNTLGYNCSGIPVLDYEIWYLQRDHIKWCQDFMNAYHDFSGVWPVLYISASHCPDFKSSWIPDKCGLWVAGYPQDFDKWPAANDMPYNVSPWQFAAIWQFASDFHISGFTGDIDADLAFMDAAAWIKYAGGSKLQQTQEKKQTKSCEQLAEEVIAGKWGNGWNRKNALDSAYGVGTYDHVQIIVNDKLGLDGC